MEKFQALIELSLIIFGFFISSAVIAKVIFNDICKQDKEPDDAIFWKRFNKNLEKHKSRN